MFILLSLGQEISLSDFQSDHLSVLMPNIGAFFLLFAFHKLYFLYFWDFFVKKIGVLPIHKKMCCYRGVTMRFGWSPAAFLLGAGCRRGSTATFMAPDRIAKLFRGRFFLFLREESEDFGRWNRILERKNLYFWREKLRLGPARRNFFLQNLHFIF